MSATSQNASPADGAGARRGKASLEKAQRRRGRPTEDEARRRLDALLDRAFDMFCDRGFEQTTMEAVASSLRMTKRTIYARFEDKNALFTATMARAMARLAQPKDIWLGLMSDDLEETLIRIARARILHLSRPDMVRLQRLVGAESYRFPDLYAAAYETGTRPLVEVLTALLRRHAALGALRATRYDLAALAFMSLVVGGPARLAAAGAPLSERAIEKRVAFNVALFLRGVLAHRPETARRRAVAARPHRGRLQ